MLDVNFAFSSNGEGFAEHDFLTDKERTFGMDEFPFSLRAYLMETVASGRSGVNLEHIQAAVVFDFEDMRVSADEQT